MALNKKIPTARASDICHADIVIAGLYVTGQDIGGLYDSTYDLLAEGPASSFALCSGGIAVRNIRRTVRRKTQDVKSE